MQNKLQELIFKRLSQEEFSTHNEMYLYYSLQMACLFSAVAYGGLSLLFSVSGVGMMVKTSMGFAFTAVLCLVLVRCLHWFPLVGVWLTAMAVVHTAMAIVIMGADSYLVVYYVLALVLQFIIPYARVAVRGGFVAVILVILVASAVWGYTMAPAVELGNYKLPIALFNMLVGLAGVCIELWFMVTVRNVIESISLARLDEMTGRAQRDALTGLYNRRYANALFREMRKAGQGGCVAMVDIDDFKKLNDSYGHDAGDAVLRSTAAALQEGVRKSDRVVRWGGEEFLLVLPDAGIDDALASLQRLRENISGQAVYSQDTELWATVTIGLALLNPADIPGSIRRCDEKLYKGKVSGKNRVEV